MIHQDLQVVTVVVLLLCLTTSTPTTSASACNVDPPNQCPWYNPALPDTQRISALVQHLTTPEKIQLMGSMSPAVPRLHVPAYAWWSEAAHGIAWAGIATVFPCSMALGATFDPKNVEAAGKAMSDEARAKHINHLNGTSGDSDRYFGLDFFAPNINIVKDIRWGRAQETYGEDPELTGALGAAVIRGIQQYNATTQRYKTIATAKHFAAYNLESNFAVNGTNGQYRLMYNANVSHADLHQTYFPGFERAVVDGKSGSIMCSYNSINSFPMCASPLLQSELRETLDFQGYIISDDGALDFMVDQHKWVSNHTMATAAALNAGVDINLGTVYQDGSLQEALSLKLVTMDQIDISLSRALKARLQMGLFEDSTTRKLDPYNHVSMDVVDSKAHRALARTLATESLVLLKNDNNVLPLHTPVASTVSNASTASVNLLIVGPNANRTETLLSNYPGCKTSPGSKVVKACTLITPWAGLQAGVKYNLTYVSGVDIDTDDVSRIPAAVELAQAADVVIFVGGYITCQETGDQCIEAEARDRASNNNPQQKPKDFGTGLPSTQLLFLQTLASNTTTPIVLVVMSGSGVSLPFAMASPRVGAVIQQFYPGEEGGTALADVIYGRSNPSGRMPVTVPHDVSQLSWDYLNSSMSVLPGRTYRYLDETIAPPMVWFGDGLSYNTYQYTDMSVTPTKVRAGNQSLSSTVAITVTVTNNGEWKKTNGLSDHVVMVFCSLKVPSDPMNKLLHSLPKRTMIGFQRITGMKAHETRTITMQVLLNRLRLVNHMDVYQIIGGEYDLWVGGANDPQVDATLTAV
jgi:beta-glucosidase